MNNQAKNECCELCMPSVGNPTDRFCINPNCPCHLPKQKEEFTFTFKEGVITCCAVCGISSFSHFHGAGTLPNDFKIIEQEIKPYFESEEVSKCDGCKLFESMGVHSFTCPIRKEKIEITVKSEEEVKCTCPDWLRIHGKECPKFVKSESTMESRWDKVKEELLTVKNGTWWASDEDYILRFLETEITKAKEEEKEKVLSNFIRFVTKINVEGGGSGRRLKMQILDFINKQ